jgi:hypothetical protein
VSIQSSTPRSQLGQTFWKCSYRHVCACSLPHHGQCCIGYISPPLHRLQRRWNLKPLGARNGSALESWSAMSRPHHGQWL